MMFKPKLIRGEDWGKLVDRVREISEREEVEHDICLIGSHARGDASIISDVDLVMFTMGEPKLKTTEIIHLNSVSATIFAVDVLKLLSSKTVDFYSINNILEAKLIYGRGEVLGRARDEVYGREIDLESTRRLIYMAFSNRLLSALHNVTLDYGEGIRDLRVCLAKTRLYIKLFKQRVNPWTIMPYRYVAGNMVETLLDSLYYSKSYDELSLKLESLNLKPTMSRLFKGRDEVMGRIVESVVGRCGFAGKYVENYVYLYLIVEEYVRSRVWRKLPGRWSIEEKFKDVNHDMTNIMYNGKTPIWIVSTGYGIKYYK